MNSQVWNLLCDSTVRVDFPVDYCSAVCSLVLSGMAELDYGLYPSREMQMDWLKEYLQAYKLFTKKTEEVNQRELETLYVQVNKFALVRRKLCFPTLMNKESGYHAASHV